MTAVVAISHRDYDAVLFDLDGVLTRTARVHDAAWKKLFDSFLEQCATRSGEPFVPFEISTDYSRYVDGKPRNDGVVDFLVSLGIALPLGASDDGPDVESVIGLGNQKQGYFLEHLAQFGVESYEESLSLVRKLRRAEIRTAVVEAGHNGHFGYVVGVDRSGQAEALRKAGADAVVTDLSQLQVAEESPPTWSIVFDGFDPAQEGVREALCTLGNGYFATRGAFSGVAADDIHYPGTCLAGGYNRLSTDIVGHVVEKEGYRARYNYIQRLDLILEGESDSTNRYKLSKQPDVLMLFYLFSAEEIGELFEHMGYLFEYDTIPRNVAYYKSRSSHGSTLSRVVYAWVLARSNRPRAMEFFAEALQSDVSDVQRGTTAEGIHLGAMAGTVDQVMRVSTGIEARGNVLHLAPELPREMERLDMRIRYRGHSLDLRLTRDSLTVRGHDAAEPPFSLCVDGKVSEFVSGSTRLFQLGKKAAGNPGEPLKTASCTKVESRKPEMEKPCGN